MDALLDHLARHQLQPLLEVLPEFGVRPVQVADERLQRVQLPEEVFGGGAAVALALPALLLEALVDGLRDRRLHQVDVAHDERRKGVAQVLVEAAVLQVVFGSENKRYLGAPEVNMYILLAHKFMDYLNADIFLALMNIVLDKIKSAVKL